MTGFTACAEFGSYAFVHPVVRRLPQREHLMVEQGLLKTFGRVMPLLMAVCVPLSISYAVHLSGREGVGIAWGSAAAFGAALLSTIVFNVPINLATARFDPARPPEAFKAIRSRWEFFQAVRSWLLLVGFVLVSLATAAQIR